MPVTAPISGPKAKPDSITVRFSKLNLKVSPTETAKNLPKTILTATKSATVTITLVLAKFLIPKMHLFLILDIKIPPPPHTTGKKEKFYPMKRDAKLRPQPIGFRLTGNSPSHQHFTPEFLLFKFILSIKLLITFVKAYVFVA
jgi:hypothetical protein